MRINILFLFLFFAISSFSQEKVRIKGFYEEANTGDGAQFKPWMRGYLTYILPLIVLAVFVLGICDKFGML